MKLNFQKKNEKNFDRALDVVKQIKSNSKKKNYSTTSYRK